MNRYRLIYPYDSDNVYMANNITKASKECYKELKASKNKDPHFCVMNIDTNEIYNFQIPKYLNLKGGGEDEVLQEGDIDKKQNEKKDEEKQDEKKSEEDETKINKKEEIQIIESQINELKKKLYELKKEVYGSDNLKDKPVEKPVTKRPYSIYKNSMSRLTEFEQLENYEKKDDCEIM